jgi:hypothetical protein
MSKSKPVLITELVQINDLGNQYQVLIPLTQGGTVEHEPFPKSLEGLVAAMQLATEICAGKFFLRRVVKTEVVSNALQLEGTFVRKTKGGES